MSFRGSDLTRHQDIPVQHVQARDCRHGEIPYW